MNGCNKHYTKYSSLASHFHKIHKSTVLTLNTILDQDPLPDHENQDTDCPPEPVSDIIDVVNVESIKQKFGLFLLKLFSKYILPESVIMGMLLIILSVFT